MKRLDATVAGVCVHVRSSVALPPRWPPAPLAHYTHWKQTVFYMQDVVTVAAGEEMKVGWGGAPTRVQMKLLARACVAGAAGMDS
jgi:hypothetical protein